MPEFEIVETQEKPYLYIKKVCSMEPADISKHMGEALEAVWAFLQSHEIQMTGPALAVYPAYDPDQIEFHAGFFVSEDDMKRAEGEVKAAKTPALKALSTTHVGSYGSLRDTYEVMMNHIAEQKLTQSMPTWEIYVDDPNTTPVQNLRTEIFIAVK